MFTQSIFGSRHAEPRVSCLGGALRFASFRRAKPVAGVKPEVAFEVQ